MTLPPSAPRTGLCASLPRSQHWKPSAPKGPLLEGSPAHQRGKRLLVRVLSPEKNPTKISPPPPKKASEQPLQSASGSSLGSRSTSSIDLPESYSSLSIDGVQKKNRSNGSGTGNSADESPMFFEAQLCRLYYFSDNQRDVFQHLVEAMKSSRFALAALATATIVLTVTQASETSVDSPVILFGSGLTVGDVASWVDTLLIGSLISYAIGPFQQVVSARPQQMAFCFQGVNRLALVFQQLSLGSIAVSTVTALEAAAKYPPLVVGTSAVFFIVAVIRSAAIWWVINQHATNGEEVSRTLSAVRSFNSSTSSYSQQMPLLDRWAVFLAFGYLLQYEDTTEVQSPSSNISSQQVTQPEHSSHASSHGIDASTSPGEVIMGALESLAILADPSQKASHEQLLGEGSRACSEGDSKQQGKHSTAPGNNSDQHSYASHRAMSTSGNGSPSSVNGSSSLSSPSSSSSLSSSSLSPQHHTDRKVEDTTGDGSGAGSSSVAAQGPVDTSPPYDFNQAEKRILWSLTEASSTAGLALGLQAFVTLMLTVADYGTQEYPGVISNGINAVNKAVMTALCFNACASYDRALHTTGESDVQHLLDGLGTKGLTGLFSSLAVLSWAVTFATLAGLALPLVEENMYARAVGDGLSHRTAEAVIEILEYARAILRGI